MYNCSMFNLLFIVDGNEDVHVFIENNDIVNSCRTLENVLNKN